jgi:hypothetical protein
VLTWGLELPQDKIDAVLWLYDGKFLDAEEARHYVKGYLPEAQPRNYPDSEYDTLRRFVLKQLREALTALLFPGV